MIARFRLIIAFILLLLQSSTVYATIIDFQSIPYGVYDSLTFSDFTLTNLNGKFDVWYVSPFEAISDSAIISSFQHPNDVSPFLLSFNKSVHGVHSFTIGVGDYGVDSDSIFLEIYDSTMNRLGIIVRENVPNRVGGFYVSLDSETEIMYAKFWSTGSFPGSVYWDNITYTATPSVDGHPNGTTDGHLNDAIKSERFSLGRPRLVMCL